MVAAAMKAVFVIQAPDQVRAHWQKITEMLRKQLPGTVPVIEAARDAVLAFLHYPQEEWQLERRRFFSEATMAKFPQSVELLELTAANLTVPAAPVPAAIR